MDAGGGARNGVGVGGGGEGDGEVGSWEEGVAEGWGGKEDSL